MFSSNRWELLITCEHATCFVPRSFKYLFANHGDILHSHRGWDPGTLEIGNVLSRRFGFPLFRTRVTRLLVEANRSIGHKRIFSVFSAGLDPKTKQFLLSEYYYSYRDAVESWILTRMTDRSNVLHLSLHSFTPILNRIPRSADIGLLYDPRRDSERFYCERLKASLAELLPNWRIRKNYPYLGRADGFTTSLRKIYSDDRYCGIELEVNQKFVHEPRWHSTHKLLIAQAINSLIRYPPPVCSGGEHRW